MFSYSQCKVCELVFVNPRPTLQSLRDYYVHQTAVLDEYWTAKLGHKPEHSTGVSASGLATVDQMLRLRRGPGRFLDVGAGDGWGSASAALRGLSVTALEIDEFCATEIERNPGVVCRRVLLEDFDAPPESFDYILMSHVLEHSDDPKNFIRRAHELLAPGGVLWIILPNFNGIYRRLWGLGDPWFSPPAHLNHFNRCSLSILCRNTGFRVARTEDIFGVPKDLIARRLPKSRWATPIIEAGTIAASHAANVALRIARAGNVLSLGAVKPMPSNRSASDGNGNSRDATAKADK